MIWLADTVLGFPAALKASFRQEEYTSIETKIPRDTSFMVNLRTMRVWWHLGI